MQSPYPFPFETDGKTRFIYCLKDYITSIGHEDLTSARIINELDQLDDSLRRMACDPLYAHVALHSEVEIANALFDISSNRTPGNFAVAHFFLERYRYLDFSISGLACATIETLTREDIEGVVAEITEKALAKSPDEIGKHDYIKWAIDAKDPMFGKGPALALYQIDPALLGIYTHDHERYFVLRSTEMAPRWKKLVEEARLILKRGHFDNKPYDECLSGILARQDWIKPRDVHLAKAMINHRFNYAAVIEGWKDKAAVMDRLGDKLTSYHNSQPWLERYTRLVVHLAHAMNLQGSHPTIDHLMDTILLPQHLHRDETGKALQTLSSLEGKMDTAFTQNLKVIQEARGMEPDSEAYYSLLDAKGLGAQALAYIKRVCKGDASKLVRMMTATGLEKRHRISNKAREDAMSIDLGL